VRNSIQALAPQYKAPRPYLQQFHPQRLLDALNGNCDFRMVVSSDASEVIEAGKAKELYVAELQTLVNAWIDSGRAADGVETPRDRNVERKPWLLFNKHFDEPLNQAYNDTFFGGEQPTVFDQVDLWLVDNPPSVTLTNTGELEISLRQSRKGGRVSLIAAALREARILFFLLMTSEAKYAIFRCRHPDCGTYYMLEKPRGLYKQGTVCPQHRRQQGTIRKRKQDHAQAIQIAAEALLCWPKLSRSTRANYKREKNYIASKLTRFGIGAKWVTRNLTEIEAHAR
jgi:hypothetical protein